ncbi:hypothetical protein Ddye_008295 [Dipteronia dyeriana]|uniref:Uncharacterized protein n=1 Tax=Dipteronia dyeriana TaxID=168575 RepID=A0AAE0CLS3_9ROSI|nr:hypothetical protein Ddye_008295 [Dipteronia dyeriana]
MIAEEIAKLCEALSILEKEMSVHTLNVILKDKGEQWLSLCLVGKILTSKPVNREVFIDVMNKNMLCEICESDSLGDVAKVRADMGAINAAIKYIPRKKGLGGQMINHDMEKQAACSGNEEMDIVFNSTSTDGPKMVADDSDI